MAVLEQTPIASSVANGLTVTFPHAFKLLNAADLLVVAFLDGVTSTYTLGVDYTVTGVGQDSGAVVFASAPASGSVVTRARATKIERLTDYQNNGDLPAATLNADLDRLVLMMQDLFSGSNVAPNVLRAPVGETIAGLPPASDRAGYLLGFDAAGQALMVPGQPGTETGLALDLASTAPGKGASMVGYLRPGPGAVGRTVQSAMADFVNVRDFGAVGDWNGATGHDDTAAIQRAVDYALQIEESGGVPVILFPGTQGVYGVSGSIVISSANVTITADGVARIQPMVLTTASTYPVISLTGSASRVSIKNLTVYMFGTLCSGIAAPNIWRQAEIHNCQFVGGSVGINMSSGSLDKWGVTISKCRFQDVATGIDWSMNGQTGTVADCLFYNCGMGLQATTGWQLNVNGSVFESAGSLRGKAVKLTNIVGAVFTACQGELLFRDGSATGVAADYGYQFVNSTVTAIGCRWWGGGWGSVAPGNSRQYGVHLDNSTLTLIDTALYGFQGWAITGVNSARLVSDLISAVDYKLSGDLTIDTSAEMGDNLVCDGAFERFRTSGSGQIPFSWTQSGGTTAARRTSSLMGTSSVAALDLPAGNQVETNAFNVAAGQWLAIRFWLLIANAPGIRCAIVNSDTAAVIDYVLGTDINVSGGMSKQGLITWSLRVPAGVRRMHLVFSVVSPNTSAAIEEVAVYVVRSSATPASVYSDNDSTFGFRGSLAPVLRYRVSPIRVHTAAPGVDTWSVNDRVQQRTAVVGQPKAWICTVGGTPGTWVSEGNL
jgi:hypothetical protein